MELRRYLEILRRRWWLLLLGPLVAGTAAYLFSSSLTPTYSASATLLVNEGEQAGPLEYEDVLASERLTNTYAQLAQSQPVLEEVLEESGLSLTARELDKKVSVDTVRDTQLLRISVKDQDPALAASLADLVATSFIELNASDLGSPGSISIAEPAKVPQDPVSPQVIRDTVLGAFLGLLLAAGVAALLEYLDDKVKAPADIEHHAGCPTLAEIHRFDARTPLARLRGGRASAPRERELVMADPNSPQAEAYRILRTNVQFASVGKPVQTMVVTSANPQEGKSTTCVNLAAAFAQNGRKVVLIDSDLRRPSLHLFFGLSNRKGLTNFLLDSQSDADSFLQHTSIENLHVLPAGPPPPNPAELLGNGNLNAVIGKLLKSAELVIFDSPPLLAAADASLLAARVDATILVVDSQKARPGGVVKARDVLTMANARLLGAVLNKINRRQLDYYGSYTRDSLSKAQASQQETVFRSPKTEVPRLPRPPLRRWGEIKPGTPADMLTPRMEFTANGKGKNGSENGHAMAVPLARNGKDQGHGPLAGTLALEGVTDFDLLMSIIDRLSGAGSVESAGITHYTEGSARLEVKFARPLSESELLGSLSQAAGRPVRNEGSAYVIETDAVHTR